MKIYTDFHWQPRMSEKNVLLLFTILLQIGPFMDNCKIWLYFTATFWKDVPVTAADLCHDGRRNELPGQLHEALPARRSSFPWFDVGNICVVCLTCAYPSHEPSGKS